MYPDRLELTGWTLGGRYRRCISLDRIDEIDHDGGRLLLELQNGERVALGMEEAAHWAGVLRAHRRTQEVAH
jgi:hypothetical protein